jgi:hypothetical protein
MPASGNALHKLWSFAGVGLLAAALSAGPAWAQSETKEQSATDAKAPAKDAKETTKDTPKSDTNKSDTNKSDSKDSSKASAKDAKDSAPKKSANVKDSAKDSAKDTAPATRDRAKDSAKDTADAKDRDRETSKTTKETGKDASRSARDQARETTEDARDRREPRGTREADVRDRRDIDRRDIDRSDIDRSDIDRSDIDRRETDRRETDRSDIRDDARTDVRSETRTRRDRDVSRTRIANFRADSVTTRDLGITFGRVSNRGLVIDDLSRTTVLADLGLRRGDVLLSVADHRVRNERDFIHYLFEPDIRNEVVTVVVLRDGREVPIEVRPVTIIEQIVSVRDDYDPLGHFGIAVDDRRANEVVVVRVIPDSPAFVAGIRPGDVITTFHGDPVRGRREFVRVIEQVQPGEIPVRVNRNRQTRELVVDMPRIESSTAVRRSAGRPDFDVDRPAIERREERRENRIERREERRDGDLPRAVPVESRPTASAAQPSRPLVVRPFFASNR